MKTVDNLSDRRRAVANITSSFFQETRLGSDAIVGSCIALDFLACRRFSNRSNNAWAWFPALMYTAPAYIPPKYDWDPHGDNPQDIVHRSWEICLSAVLQTGNKFPPI
jgi:hypothetical protein